MTAKNSMIEPELEVVVRAKTLVADGTVLLDLQLPSGGDLPTWTPGAHIDLNITDDLTPQYSLCGKPSDRSTWQVAVLRDPNGRGGSKFLHDELAVGDTISTRGPRNHFELVPAARYLFIAGGIGITPLLPMMAAAEASGTPWDLVYVGHSRSTMAFIDELAVTYPGHVQLFPRDETDRPDLVRLLAMPADDLLVYACGPTNLLESIEAAMAHWPAGALHLEHFSPKNMGEPVLSTAFEVELAVSGKTIQVTPDISILEAAREAGVRILSSCQEGTCGTCETNILEGLADHRDSLLTKEEQEANETMMICVSRARTPRLKLEL